MDVSHGPLLEKHSSGVANLSSGKSLLTMKGAGTPLPNDAQPRAHYSPVFSSSSLSVQSSLTGLVPALSCLRPSRCLVRARLRVCNVSPWTNLRAAQLPSSLIGCARSRGTDPLICILHFSSSPVRSRARAFPGVARLVPLWPVLEQLKTHPKTHYEPL